MRIFECAVGAGWWRWSWDQCLACCAPPGQTEFSQSTQEQNRPLGSAHRGLLRWLEGINWSPLKKSQCQGIGWTGAGVSGSPGHGNEVTTQGLQRSPSAPSHLCAVWPSSRQLLPLIIPPNGWIRFPLTSSCLHNNIPPSLRPDAPSSRHGPLFLPTDLASVGNKALDYIHTSFVEHT